MQQYSIKCAFCKGTGSNPHYKASCPVCKGARNNQITGVYTTCDDCRGSGRKSGTTLTCFTCTGVGVVPDTRQAIKEARQGIRKIQAEMEEERAHLADR